MPSYFVEDANLVETCNKGLAKSLFRLALIANSLFSLLFFKKWNRTFLIGFVVFHIFLYFFITRIYVAISMGEWASFQAYKHAVKSDPDYSRYDTPVNQFNTITQFFLQQPINKQRIIYLIIIISFIFVWIPILFMSPKDLDLDVSTVGTSKTE